MRNLMRKEKINKKRRKNMKIRLGGLVKNRTIRTISGKEVMMFRKRKGSGPDTENSSDNSLVTVTNRKNINRLFFLAELIIVILFLFG